MGLKIDSCEEKSGTEETRERKTNECRYEQNLLVLHNPDNEDTVVRSENVLPPKFSVVLVVGVGPRIDL